MKPLRKIFMISALAVGTSIGGGVYFIEKGWTQVGRDDAKHVQIENYLAHGKNAGSADFLRKQKELKKVEEDKESWRHRNGNTLMISLLCTIFSLVGGVYAHDRQEAREDDAACEEALKQSQAASAPPPSPPPAPVSAPKQKKPRAKRVPKAAPVDLNPGIALQTEIETAPKVQFKRSRVARKP